MHLQRDFSTSTNRHNPCQADSYLQSLTIMLEWWIRPISFGKEKLTGWDCFLDILWATLRSASPRPVLRTLLCVHACSTHKYGRLPSHEICRFLTLIACIGKRLGLAVCQHLTSPHSLVLFLIYFQAIPFAQVFLSFPLSCLIYLTHWRRPPCS